jgi:hypothetical protein
LQSFPKDKYLEKEINESSSEYFIRGIRHHLMEQRANWERLTKASLGNEYENIFNPKAIHTPALKIPEHYFSENPIHTTNYKIDGISEIAGDISKKYSNSLKQNKISSNINICIAALALIVSGISLWIAYDSSKDTKENNRKSELQSSAVEEKINNITESLKKDKIAIEKVINVNLENLPKTEKNNDLFFSILKFTRSFVKSFKNRHKYESSRRIYCLSSYHKNSKLLPKFQ